MWDALRELSHALPGSVRVVVIRATGPTFSAGLDTALLTPGVESPLRALAARGATAASAQIARWQQAFDWTSRPDLISIAAVQGHAIGAGFQLALGADIRIAATDAQFAIAEPRLGLVPDLGGTGRLVSLLGYAAALELCLTGRRVGAQEARALGLVNSVHPPAQLHGEAARLADAICTLERDVAAETKALLLAADRRSQADQERAEREAQFRRLRTLAGMDPTGRADPTI